ncbi:glycoside hydrolase family 43 protein [Aquibacillus salsiterrae]|uniref:Glycoside hydrolase family 43 protein n=1 Tax=Aquibacillus salsiterrae TaxID=2950439 RepID=A0A9X3WEM1_9BACI|nr:glycoside hydrolase family 43 protein [Aquibacillus salsiterrae]MDC3416009.1 glycoside hydrolase family 43 protein [Aquibacillus salsiterrae]
MIKNKDIQIRDPFVFTDVNSGKYYLFGSTDKNIWGKGVGFDYYVGKDLEHWEGPFQAFRPNERFFSEDNFWAPEVHEYQGKYYMFATFMSKQSRIRGTAILVADKLTGPYQPHSNGPVTPNDWQCLDGTLYVDQDGIPWMIFCHEWVQVGDGEICAIQLANDLKESVGEPQKLFNASNAPWPTSFQHERFPNQKNYVTDGPYIYQTNDNDLLLLWASFVDNVYAQGIARSLTGKITGPWEHEKIPIYQQDGGHGMIFKTFEGKSILTLHAPNKTPNERPIFIDIVEQDGKLIVQK